MNFFRLLSLLFLALVFAACGGSLNDDSTKAKMDRDNEKTLGEDSTVVGVYQGKLALDSDGRNLPGKVILYVAWENDGVDTNNQTKRRPVLSGQFKLDGVGELDDANFKAFFDINSGSVSLTQPEGAAAATVCEVGAKDPKFSITGTILGGHLHGDANGQSGRLGTIDMDKISSDATQPAGDESARMEAAYAKVVGSYDGTVLNQGTPLAANIVFKIEKIPLPNSVGVTCPTLKAQFKFPHDTGLINDTTYAVTYRESSGQVVMNAIESGNASTCPIGVPDMTSRIEGQVSGGKLVGAMSGAVVGNLAAKRTSMNSEFMNDQFTRLQDSYSAVEGVYGGQFANTNGDRFKVRIALWVGADFIDKDKKLKCPVLQGVYSRPDMTSEIGQILLSATYNRASSLLTILKSDAEGGQECKQAGCRDLTINDASWNQSGFTGTMSWFKVQPGTISMKRCSAGQHVNNAGNCVH